MNENKILEEQHSVKFSINAKLKYSAEFKCYGKTPKEALDRTTKLAITIEGIIRDKNTVKTNA